MSFPQNWAIKAPPGIQRFCRILTQISFSLVSLSNTHTFALKRITLKSTGWHASHTEFYHTADYQWVNLCWQVKSLLCKPYSQALPAICWMRQHPEISRQLITKTVPCNHLSWVNGAFVNPGLLAQTELSLFWISQAHCCQNTSSFPRTDYK